MTTHARKLKGLNELAPESVDPRGSQALMAELPGLAVAFDAGEMAALFQDALLGGSSPGWEVASCRPGQTTYLPGECCIIRYELEVANRTSGDRLRSLVNARIFPSTEAAAGYARDRLFPLVDRVRDRAGLEAFDNLVAILEDVRAAVAVFPVDGDLPTLVEATDPRRIEEIASRVLPETSGGRLVPTGVQVEPGHYGRQHRCVLRYAVDAVEAGTDVPSSVVLYGKVASDGRGEVADSAIRALGDWMEQQEPARRFRLPPPLGFYPDLGLSLLGTMDGVPAVGALLKARVGQDDRRLGGPTLEDSIEECARVVAALHASALSLGPRRTPAGEVAWLDSRLSALHRIAPDLGSVLRDSLAGAEEKLGSSQELAPRLSHGDFSHKNLLFDGNGRPGLVDFDTICRAEPSLDVGHFRGYLRLAVHKLQPSPEDSSMTDELAERFMDTYLGAAGEGLGDESLLRERAAAYEVLGLLRLALHSWQKFKGSRLALVIALLDDQRG